MDDIDRYAMTRFNTAKRAGDQRRMLVCWAAFHRHADWMHDEHAKLRAEVERLRNAAAQLRLDAAGWENASTKPAVYRWLIRRLDALTREDGEG